MATGDAGSGVAPAVAQQSASAAADSAPAPLPPDRARAAEAPPVPRLFEALEAVLAPLDKQARKVAGWLEQNRPKRLKVLVSPTVRTRQTASAFTDTFDIVTALDTDAEVGPPDCGERLAGRQWRLPHRRPPALARPPRRAVAVRCGGRLDDQEGRVVVVLQSRA